MQTKIAVLSALAASLAMAQSKTSTFSRDFLLSFNDAEKHVVDLAKAMPEEKYSWRPGDGVRSVSEVYVHIANGNRLLLAVSSGPIPREGFMKMVRDNEQREKTLTSKAEVVADLEASFREVHKALESAGAEALSKPIKFFGEDATPHAAYMSILEHVSEHLGQSIAYARMNGVVPPWSK